MSLALLLALQAAAPPAPAPVLADFDLARVKPPTETGRITDCRPADPSEIVVCGRRGDEAAAYPMEEMERRYREKPLTAEVGIGGGATARAYVEQVELPGGNISRRVMVGVKLPF